MISLNIFTFHPTFDKQLRKIKKVKSGLPSPKFRIWPSPNPNLILKLGFSRIRFQKGQIHPNPSPNLGFGRSLIYSLFFLFFILYYNYSFVKFMSLFNSYYLLKNKKQTAKFEIYPKYINILQLTHYNKNIEK